MKRTVSGIVLTLLLISMLTSTLNILGEVDDTIYVGEIPPQPPVVTNTLHVGHVGWGPVYADPVRAYDEYSQELIFNVYDTLIMFGEPVTNDFGTWDTYEQYWEYSPSLATNVPTRKDVTKTVNSTDVNLADPTGSIWSDDSTCIGWADNHATCSLDEDDVVYMVEADGSYRTWFVQSFNASPPASVTLWRGSYVFHIRTDPVIDFVNETGDVVDSFDVYDAEYSLERGLVQDQVDSPMWMFYKPLFDQMNSDFFASNTTEPTAMSLAHLIDDAIEVSGNNLTINVGIPFPDMAFKQILSQTWASILSKQFSISIGCWNGDLYTDSNGNGYPDWFETVRRANNTPYDREFRYVGTGPYHITTFDCSSDLVALTRNALYWRGWPAPGTKSYLETVEIHYISNWTERRDNFVSCNLDVCEVPAMNMRELLDTYGEPLYPEIKTIKNLVGPKVEIVCFTFTVNLKDYWGQYFIGSGNFPDGIPSDFFNNTHVRKAFAYAFNHTKYIKEKYFGESLSPTTPLIEGLYPDYRTGISGYDVNFDLAEAELKNAVFDEQSVWETGFTLIIPYPYWSNSPKWAQIIQDFFAELSTYDNRPQEWPDFVVNINPIYPYLGIFWPEPNEIPIAKYAWLADFADADNFMRPYMYSKGVFAYFQNYTVVNGWGSRKDELIDLAIKTQDISERAAIYAELEQIYIEDCSSFPIAQPVERKWLKYWVKGWYHNGLYPSDYYYHMYKYNVCWGSVYGPTGVPDDMCAMRDIGWVANHFGAKAPDLAGTPPYDPRWAPGRYSCGGSDVTGDRIVNMRDIGFMCAHFGHGIGDP